jgi:hypothetical protein
VLAYRPNKFMDLKPIDLTIQTRIAQYKPNDFVGLMSVRAGAHSQAREIIGFLFCKTHSTARGSRHSNSSK